MDGNERRVLIQPHLNIKRIINVLYPVKCPFCGKITQDGICEDCRRAYPFIGEPICKKCGKPLGDSEKEYCYDCTRKQHVFCEGRALWIHKGKVSEAVYAVKYKNKRIYGEIFGAEMGKQFSSYLHRHRISLLIPIPLHKKRRRYRGFNQAEILARKISEYSGIPVDTDSLVRVKGTVAQKELDDKQRRRNIKNAFAVTRNIYAGNVALIDDIYTTGSTLDEAADTLLASGVGKVYFLVISIGQGF